MQFVLVFGPWCDQHVGPYLLSTSLVNKLADFAEPKWRAAVPDPPASVIGTGMNARFTGGPIAVRFGDQEYPGSSPIVSPQRPGYASLPAYYSGLRRPSTLLTDATYGANFYRICHYWISLLVASTAGVVSQAVFGRRAT